MVATAVTDLGGTVAMAGLAVVVAMWSAWRGRRGHAALLVVTAVEAGGLVSLIKHLVGRIRPPQAVQLVLETNPSFPSGHTLGSTAVIGVVTVVMLTRSRGRLRRAVLAMAAVAAIVAIGLSRLYLGVHWATDVLAGWLIGGAWLAVCVGVALWCTGQGRVAAWMTSRRLPTV